VQITLPSGPSPHISLLTFPLREAADWNSLKLRLEEFAMKQAFLLPAAATAALTTLALTAPPAAADTGEGYVGYHHMMGGGWFMGPFMMMVLIIFLVGAGIYVLRSLGHTAKPGAAGAHDSALTILRERFAKGEIDREEFEERRKALE
jgi:putative membrane protein